MITFEDIQRLKVQKMKSVRRLKLRTFGRIPRHLLDSRIGQMAEFEDCMTRYEHSLEVA